MESKHFKGVFICLSVLLIAFVVLNGCHSSSDDDDDDDEPTLEKVEFVDGLFDSLSIGDEVILKFNLVYSDGHKEEVDASESLDKFSYTIKTHTDCAKVENGILKALKAGKPNLYAYYEISEGNHKTVSQEITINEPAATDTPVLMSISDFDLSSLPSPYNQGVFTVDATLPINLMPTLQAKYSKGEPKTLQASLTSGTGNNYKLVLPENDLVEVKDGGILAKKAGALKVYATYTEGTKTVQTKDLYITIKAKDAPKTQSIVVSTNKTELETGEVATLSVIATDDLGQKEDISSTANYKISPESETAYSILGNKLTAKSVDNDTSFTITVLYDGCTNDCSIIIKKATTEAPPKEEKPEETVKTLESISSTSIKDIPFGGEVDLPKNVTATYSDKTTGLVSATWTSKDTTIVKIEGGKAKAQEGKSGKTSLVATYKEGSVTKTCEVPITVLEKGAAILQNISVSLSKTEIKAGESATLTVNASYSDDTTKDVTKDAIFEDSGNGIVVVKDGKISVSKSPSSDLDVTITVSFGGKSATGKITVKKGETAPEKPGESEQNDSDVELGFDFSELTKDDSGSSEDPEKPEKPGDGDDEVEGDETPELTPLPDGLTIFVKADASPTLWAWEKESSTEGKACTQLMGGTWPGISMTSAESYMNDGAGWWMLTIPSKHLSTPPKTIHFKVNSNPSSDDGITGKNTTFWYDGTACVDKDPTKPKVATKPSIYISPASGNVSLKGSVIVKIDNGGSPITAATVSVAGDASKTYSLTDFKDNALMISISALGISAESKKINVTATAKNAKGETTEAVSLVTKDIKEDTFTWDNILCYFVLTDRFHNGDTNNDHSYGRKSGGNIPTVATFHGGDIKGLTAKMDYFKKLGVNAIWITAPYEQMHGWCDGKDSKFPHYAFHGYYTEDWTGMDKNMGTIEEFRTFVNTCHANGIRVVMDVVMNHTGYNTVNDMVTYDFGAFKGTKPAYDWCAATNNKWSQGDGAGVDWTSSDWGKWWGQWVRAFDGKFGFASAGGDDITMSLAGLPDVVTEKTNSVTIPTFLRGKWTKELGTEKAMDGYANPSVANADWGGRSGDWRADNKGAPADYIVTWLSAWVREFGVDGFRCDTAKHVHMYRWGQLKDACEAALAKWRTDTTKSKVSGSADGSCAASWTQKFWMTGECFGWSSINGQGDYYTTGKFDSMINFSFNGQSGNTGRCPTTGDWGSYANIANNGDSDNNGNRNSVLSYVSSHDTGLHRSTGSIKLGTMLTLLPGGVQIYYGDESDRPNIDGMGDADMATRGDMNFLPLTDVKIVHWGKLGNFRKYNPAVGAGKGTAFARTYGDNKVFISIGTAVNVPSDGETYYNWYTGQQVTGSVTGSDTAPALISNRNPSEYGQ